MTENNIHNRNRHILLRLTSVLAVLFFAASLSLHAQLQVSTSLDTNRMRIGEQAVLRITSPFDKNFIYTWFSIPDTFNHIEVISRDTIDTLNVNNAWVLQQDIILTSFDSGAWAIPPIPMQYKKPQDTTTYTVYSSPLLLYVNTVPVDTTKAAYDIKGVIEVPWSIMDYIWWIVGGFAILGIVGAAIYFLRKSQIEKSGVQIVKVKRPAHEVAMEALHTLKEEKLWQQGQVKEYHTRLTDIIRLFIENRFGVPALELTTDEILQYSVIHTQPKDLYDGLKNMLTLADLVKFAKASPVANEHEQSFADAVEWVTRNKQTDTANPLPSNSVNTQQA